MKFLLFLSVGKHYGKPASIHFTITLYEQNQRLQIYVDNAKCGFRLESGWGWGVGVVQTQHWTAADVQSATDHRALYQLQINSLQIGVISLAMYPIMDSPYHYSTWR